MLRGFDHLFDARQMIEQMAKGSIGWRASGFALCLFVSQPMPGSFGFRNSRFQFLESQLSRIRDQLPGSFAIKGMAQPGKCGRLRCVLRVRQLRQAGGKTQK